MSKFNNRARKWKDRATFNVPSISGSYANESLIFGGRLNRTAGLSADEAFEEVMALVEGPMPAGSVLELWLRKNSDNTEGAATMDDFDYVLGGANFSTIAASASPGGIRWVLSGWPGGMIRIKSGGTLGTVAVSANAL